MNDIITATHTETGEQIKFDQSFYPKILNGQKGATIRNHAYQLGFKFDDGNKIEIVSARKILVTKTRSVVVLYELDLFPVVNLSSLELGFKSYFEAEEFYRKYIKGDAAYLHRFVLVEV